MFVRIDFILLVVGVLVASCPFPHVAPVWLPKNLHPLSASAGCSMHVLRSGVSTSTHFNPPGEKAALACRRTVSVVRVALLAAERWPALAVPFIGCRDVNVALTESLARAQTRAGIPTQARAVLRGRKGCVSAFL